jgi:hypothetical protein
MKKSKKFISCATSAEPILKSLFPTPWQGFENICLSAEYLDLKNQLIEII